MLSLRDTMCITVPHMNSLMWTLATFTVLGLIVAYCAKTNGTGLAMLSRPLRRREFEDLRQKLQLQEHVVALRLYSYSIMDRRHHCRYGGVNVCELPDWARSPNHRLPHPTTPNQNAQSG